jgi:hypothetical protein
VPLKSKLGSLIYTQKHAPSNIKRANHSTDYTPALGFNYPTQQKSAPCPEANPFALGQSFVSKTPLQFILSLINLDFNARIDLILGIADASCRTGPIGRP